MRVGAVLALLLALAVPAVAVGVAIWTLSRLSGWKALSDRYPCRSEMPTPRGRLGYGVFRGWSSCSSP